jgi:serine/threonine protein kinase
MGWKEDVSRAPIAFGDYVITRRIARGGMAEIFRARTVRAPAHPRVAPEERSDDAQWVALKMMRSELGNHDLRQKLFEREAKIVEAIRHPNVVPIHEYGENGGRHFLAMEYIAGKNLAQLVNRDPIQKCSALPLEICLYIAVEASRGLGYAHTLRDGAGQALDIVHRDVSPGNIMLSFDGRVKILDFGVARMNETNGIQTQTGTLRGKFAYMSPEQTLGSNVDARSDVFAFGVVLYELLTGQNPFKGPSPIATLDRVQRHRPAAPSHTVDGIPRELDQVLAKCLAKDPRRRFRNGTAIHEALVQFTKEQPKASQDQMALFMDIHFRRDNWREKKQLAAELEQVAAVEILDFNQTHRSDSELPDPHELQSAALEEASQSQLIAAVSGLLESNSGVAVNGVTPDAPLQLVATVQAPLDDDMETALETVFDHGGIPASLLDSTVAVDLAANVQTLRHRTVAKKSSRWPLARLAFVTGIATASIFALTALLRKPQTPTPSKSELLVQTRSVPVTKRGEALTITTIDPVTIVLPPKGRSKTIVVNPRKKITMPSRVTKTRRSRTQAYGFLNVGAKPWAIIDIDGKRWPKRTPQTGIKLTAGVHGIRVRNPNTKTQKHVRVEILEGKYKTLSFDLRKNRPAP